MNRFVKLITASLLLSGLAGCAINQPIIYKTGDITPSGATQLKWITLGVESFTDNRKSVGENRIVFVEGRETKIGDKRVCINSEEHYNKEPAAKQMTVAVAEHLKQRGAFKDVVIDTKGSADFLLQGSIRQFYSQQDFSYAAAIGSQFGLIGGLLTMKSTSLSIIKIEFADLKLTDKNGNQVTPLENVNKIFVEELPVDGYCWHSFWNANLKLREVVDLLAENVERNLIEVITKKSDEPREGASHN